jgi:hypothetical protein
MPTTIEEATALLRQGGEKQRLPQLTATLRFASQDGRGGTVALQAKSAGGTRKLLGRWVQGADEKRFLVVPPNMWSYLSSERRYRRLPFDLDQALEGTELLVRDLLPLPLATFEVQGARDVVFDGEACVEATVARRAGQQGGPAQRKIVMAEAGPDAGLDRFVGEYQANADGTYRLTREVALPKIGWLQLPVGGGVQLWIAGERRYRDTGTGATTTLSFVDADVTTKIDDTVFLPTDG